MSVEKPWSSEADLAANEQLVVVSGEQFLQLQGLIPQLVQEGRSAGGFLLYPLNESELLVQAILVACHRLDLPVAPKLAGEYEQIKNAHPRRSFC